MDYLSKNTYAENIKAAEHFLSMANKHDLGRRWNIIATITFCAFSIEAYLNHVGETTAGDEWVQWDKDTHPSPRNKLNRLIPKELKFNHMQLSMFSEIFKLRDMVAHGRNILTKKVVKRPQNNLKGAMNNLSSRFEARTTLKKVNEILVNTKDIILVINNVTIKKTKTKLWSIESGSLRTS